MLQTHLEDGVRTLTLCRAERGNALNPALVDALLEAVEEACADRSLHTLVLRGDGRNFCTGFDLSDLDAASDGDLLHRFVRIETLLAALWHAPLRTVAVVTGRAWGAGADLMAACDLRAATPGASFRFPGAGFGLVLGTRRLAERVGVDAARRLVSEGLTWGAQEARERGLLTDLVDDPDRWLASASKPLPVDRATLIQLHRATRDDRRDEDLAALVRSAALPGLKQRISAYRARQGAFS
jgi:enoyl-CoA hydratase/carnithine racemase